MEYGEPPAQKRRRHVNALAQSRYPDDALSSADHSKTSKELYTMEPSFQPLNLQLKYRPVKDVFAKVALRRWREHPKIHLESVIRKELVHDYYIREEARALWLRLVLVDMVNELKSQPFPATYQQTCNRWRERESGPLRVLDDLRILVKPPNLRKKSRQRSKMLLFERCSQRKTFSVVDRHEEVYGGRKFTSSVEIYQILGHGCSINL